MSKENTVFVIGAGASAEVNLHAGDKLVESIDAFDILKTHDLVVERIKLINKYSD